MDKENHIVYFLKAIKDVKQGSTCYVCSELCKILVILNKLHMVCSEHIDVMANCPTCLIGLEDSKIVTYKRKLTEELKVHNDSTEELSHKLKRSKPNEQTHAANVNNDFSIRRLEKKAVFDSSSLEMLHTLLVDSNVVGKHVNKHNHKGQTALQIACRLGREDYIIELLTQGAYTNTKDDAGWTPLHEVVRNNRLDLVRLLRQYNTFIDVPGQGNETPLHAAARYERADIARELIKYGADIDARNCRVETTLMLATHEFKRTLLGALEYIHTESLDVNLSQDSTIPVLSQNPFPKPDMEDIRVYCATSKPLEHLKKLCKHHKNLHHETKWSKKVTHLLVEVDEDVLCEMSFDVLQGILSCVWIIYSDWILESTEATLQPFDFYEVTGVDTDDYKGPKNARYSKYKLLPGLFDGCHFYLYMYYVLKNQKNSV